ncbi:hypothetical protein VDGE_09291 [Verticillium dahliae]|uniref:NAD(P)-binding domain-containing protein n=1 Tax=Verticillium dahliae TaxID=27337 RepID=A0A444S1I9_VERDA|nr:hypothetical protein VDGE_09291 [Verticillium dahliae]
MGDACLFHPPTTLIVGGNGKTARHLTSLLTAANPAHAVYSIIRNPDQVPSLIAIGAHPIVQDLVSGTVEDFVKILERTQPDTVVWAASNPRAPVEVDRDGAIKVIDALAQAEIPRKRYVAISSADVRDRKKPTPDWYSEADIKLSDRMWGVIEPALRAKFEADKDLRVNNRSRGIEYTIIRPGGLTEKEAEGRIRAGKVGLQGMISRADVAAVLFAAIKDEWTTGLAFDIMGPGEGDLPIKEAVRGVSAKREDTFDGYY